jgi:hypothetical protein
VSVSQSEQAFRSGSAPKVGGRPGDGGPSLAAPAPTATVNGNGRGAPRPNVYAEPPRQVPGPTTGGMATVGPRKVRLTIARVDPWSVLKLSFLLSVALGIVLVTASVVLWSVLDAMGVFSSINNELRSIGSAQSKFDINQWVGLGRVVSLTTVIAVVNVLIIMALSTLGALLYNLASSLVGGLQVTLSDD